MRGARKQNGWAHAEVCAARKAALERRLTGAHHGPLQRVRRRELAPLLHRAARGGAAVVQDGQGEVVPAVEGGLQESARCGRRCQQGERSRPSLRAWGQYTPEATCAGRRSSRRVLRCRGGGGRRPGPATRQSSGRGGRCLARGGRAAMRSRRQRGRAMAAGRRQTLLAVRQRGRQREGRASACLVQREGPQAGEPRRDWLRGLRRASAGAARRAPAAVVAACLRRKGRGATLIQRGAHAPLAPLARAA